MQRGDEKGRKLDNWIFAAIFILGIIISPWHQLGLGDNAACNCLCLLNAKDKNESEICNYTGYATHLSLLLSRIEPVSARTAQRSANARTHTQTSLHCSWKYLLIISEKIDQQIMRSEFMVDKMLQLCQHSWSKEKRTMCSDCQWIVEALFDQCCKFKAQESDFRLTTLEFSWR